MQYKSLEIERLNHAGFKIKNSETIFFDPFKVADKDIETADLIFISHEHFDHCSPDDLKKIANISTVIVAASSCRDNLAGMTANEIKYVQPGDRVDIEGIQIEAVPAYNINKFRSPGLPFHSLADNKVGFVVELDGVRIYHAGDTDNIPEMANLKDIDIALLPVSGTYVMTAEEAAEAARVISPKLVIPMHYGDIVGTEDDAKKFKELFHGLVEII